ncbi:Bug family tripartite tricarboxylate transporter substrate binding protein [Verminephrobacter eiseniae]|uniref:Bug family tripartite tricarboxylate transporter substrate binding protein n=1 Tax=Verminephrobacter eiseniae TaxID=364317 RepID=UPI0038B2D7A6
MMNRRDAIRGAAALTAAAAFGPARSRAQGGDYPRPDATIRYVVPFPAGGLTDQMARQIGQQLGERWKVNVVVDNRPGGNAQIGAEMVAKAAPDGHTLLAVTLAHAANVTLFPKAPFSLQKDLRPVALIAGSPILIVVPQASPIEDFRALITQSRARRLNAGSSGNGTPPHLALALFNALNQSAIQHVPYKGGAPAVTDLIGGQLDLIFSNFPESIAHVKTGRLRALAIASRTRHPALDKVPTTAEAGLPALLVENWTGMMAPAGMSDAAVRKLGAEVVEIVHQPEMQERMRQQGFNADARPPERFAVFLNEEIARWAQVIEGANIQPS